MVASYSRIFIIVHNDEQSHSHPRTFNFCADERGLNQPTHYNIIVLNRT
jgi:hypothetical protein